MAVLNEWRIQAAALEAYLRGKELQKPILGAQRRVEARIGQLENVAYHGKHGINDKLVAEFRLLARGFECLSDEEWRRSRRALVSVVSNKLGCVLLDERRKWAPKVTWLNADRRAV